jgi:hypothetical protein
MLLSEGQMSDYKGAALMIDAFPKAAACSVTKATTPTGSALEPLVDWMSHYPRFIIISDRVPLREREPNAKDQYGDAGSDCHPRDH